MQITPPKLDILHKKECKSKQNTELKINLDKI